METQMMDKNECESKYARQIKYLKTEKGRLKLNEARRTYYHNHPEYREKQMALKQKYRRCEKELKTEFIRLSGIVC
jgi:hypothetical protein